MDGSKPEQTMQTWNLMLNAYWRIVLQKSFVLRRIWCKILQRAVSVYLQVQARLGAAGARAVRTLNRWFAAQLWAVVAGVPPSPVYRVGSSAACTLDSGYTEWTLTSDGRQLEMIACPGRTHPDTCTEDIGIEGDSVETLRIYAN